MEFNDYTQAAAEGYRLSSSGDPVGAADLFLRLAADTAMTDMDRVYMLHNAAMCLQEVGPPERVGQLFDDAIDIERRWCRSIAREAKATWLTGTGRREEAIAIYTELMNEGWASLSQKRDYEEAIFKVRP